MFTQLDNIGHYRNQERLKPQEEKNEEERSKVDDLRGTPMSVGNLEEIIDDNHAIVSTSVGSEHYVSILSFVDKDQLEPGCSVLLNHKVKHIQQRIVIGPCMFFRFMLLWAYCLMTPTLWSLS